VRRLKVYVACYLAWLGLSALGLGVVVLGRSALVGLVRLATRDPFVVGTADRTATLLLGLGWLAGVVWLEGTLRSAAPRATGLALRVCLAELGLLALCGLIALLAPSP